MLVLNTMTMFIERICKAQRQIAHPHVRPESDMIPLWWLVALLDTAITFPIPWCLAKLFIEMVLVLSRVRVLGSRCLWEELTVGIVRELWDGQALGSGMFHPS